jgi:hypothetical protein
MILIFIYTNWNKVQFWFPFFILYFYKLASKLLNIKTEIKLFKVEILKSAWLHIEYKFDTENLFIS